MSDSILQVNLIKNKGGTATGITVDNSNANVTIKGPTLQTATNNYSALKTGESNSLGYIEKVFVGTTYYLSAAKSITNATYTHVDATWAKGPAGQNGTTTGTSESDPFAQFSSGIFTPKVSGYWLCTFSFRIASVGDQNLAWGFLQKNWAGAGPLSNTGFFGVRSYGGGSSQPAGSGAGIYALGTSDTVRLVCYQNSGGTIDVSSDHTTIGFYYLGKSAI